MIKTNRPIPAQQIKLLIFDLDGTLVDSRQDLSNSINPSEVSRNSQRVTRMLTQSNQ